MVAREAIGIHGQSKIVEHEKLIPGLRLVQVFGDFDISENDFQISILLRLENQVLSNLLRIFVFDPTTYYTFSDMLLVCSVVFRSQSTLTD